MDGEEDVRNAFADAEPAGAAERLIVFDPRDLQDKPVPSRRWMVDQWMPWHQTTSLYGDGAMGKTLLAQMLATSVALGKPWLGLEVTPCRVLAVLCEDPLDELHRRQADINTAMFCDHADLGNMRWVVRHGQDNLLMTFEKGVGSLTPFWHQIVEQAKAFGAKLIILDTLADCFGGDENSRQDARQFVQVACTRLALEIDGAVLLCAHPSMTGMASGEGTGGNTAWNNAVRSRWYLTRPPVARDEEVDDDLRVLSRKKANYARRGEEMVLRWKAGFMHVERAAIKDVIDKIVESGRNRQADTAFLTALRAMNAEGRALSHSSNARNYGPKMMRGRPETAGLSQRDLTDAMERLFQAKRIVAGQPIGTTRGNRHKQFGLVEVAPECPETTPEEPPAP